MIAEDRSHREHEVERTIARLIVAGHKDLFVARTLHMSPRTLHRILERLLYRHGLPNRAALGAFAASRGWLPEFTPNGTAVAEGASPADRDSR